MNIKQILKLITTTYVIAVTITACSRKTITTENASTVKKEHVGLDTLKTDTALYVVKRKEIKTSTPQVITVNDKAARKTVDGRLYYDLDGKRYWRNKRDGKYYLYNKSMYNNPDFQP